MLTPDIFQRVKIIGSLRDKNMIFIECDGVKWKEDLPFILFEDITKNISLVIWRILGLIGKFFAMRVKELNSNTTTR